MLFYEEEWVTDADLEKQICSSRYTSLLALMEAAKAPPRIEFRFISGVRGLDYIEDIRLTPARLNAAKDTAGEAATGTFQSKRNPSLTCNLTSQAKRRSRDNNAKRNQDFGH